MVVGFRGVFAGTSGTSREVRGVGLKMVSDIKPMTTEEKNKEKTKRKGRGKEGEKMKERDREI
jgi:hypothetical protein